MDIVKEIKGPYDFDQGLKRLTIDPIQNVDINNRSIKVPLFIENTPVVANVTALGTIENPKFHIQANTSMVDEQKLLRRIEEVFHWNIPFRKMNDHFSEKDIASLFSAFRGTPLILDFQRYGSLMKAIIHQQLNMTFAYRLTERFVKTFGDHVEGVWFYPKPEVVSELPYSALTELQFSHRKAEYVIDTSRKIVDGQLDLEKLTEEDDETVMETLKKVRGIGRWTAENFLMFALGRLDHLPVQDIGVQNGLKHFFEFDEKPKMEWIEERGKAWAPYRTYATLYIWESIENPVHVE
ncbi:DNA-3-methyladenine glycosylase family protein [Texcoconibacillus texcoconensis]|uniref:DNA-3-methyladenine glycosylase II n=1 Tax=Texcoconibacillus texcoconensis TaxID=1095777 RepID=A0A840QTL0_9BACI|nr:DNA-3-methyladenine glycosylase [Texcoconibacillus texcoconensis]MBB5174653.1 DNA-3-methyladenine glycosylase II [Texcoconibacillus texcoconensis]